MTLYTAAVLGFILGLAVSWGLHAMTGRAIADMAKRSREMADEARELAETSERITADIDRRMDELARAREWLDKIYNPVYVSSALALSKVKPDA